MCDIESKVIPRKTICVDGAVVLSGANGMPMSWQSAMNASRATSHCC